MTILFSAKRKYNEASQACLLMHTMSVLLRECCECTVSLLRAWLACCKITIARYDRTISTLSENNKRNNFVHAALKCIVCLMRI